MRWRKLLLAAAAAALATTAANAGRIDSATRAGAAGAFSSAITGVHTSTFTGGHTVTVKSEVWFDVVSGIYTYFYNLSGASSVDPIYAFSVQGPWSDPSSGSTGLTWGEVTGEIVGDVGLEDGAFGGGINFATTRAQARFEDPSGPGQGGLDSGESITIFIQSFLPPMIGSGSTLDGGTGNGSLFTVIPLPPASGLGLAGLLGLAVLRRRRNKVA